MRAEYPAGPVPAVAAVVVRGEDVLLIKRSLPPRTGMWSIPGGAIEEGETAEAAVVREALEETGVWVRPVRVLVVGDVIERDGEGRVRFHYAVADILCEHEEGEPVPGSDAANARWVPVRELHEYDVTDAALRAIQAALRERQP